MGVVGVVVLAVAAKWSRQRGEVVQVEGVVRLDVVLGRVRLVTVTR